MHLEPIVDLAPAAGLAWLIEARPRDIASRADLIPAVGALVSEAKLTAFSRANGLDLRETQELVIARYDETTLYSARAPLDPATIESAFAAHAIEIEGRAEDAPGLIRAWGTVAGKSREQIAIFGRNAVALERGRFGPLRAAEMFALAKLKRASPALKTEPLARAATLAGDAPLRAFAPGPFTGESKGGLGGLLGASTAVALAIRFPPPAPHPELSARIVLTGAWNDDAPTAAQRLAAAYTVLEQSALGRLIGLDKPVAGPNASFTADALTLEVTYDALALAHGVHAALDAEIEEILRLGASR
jgi:hypothetical protein